MGVFFLIIYSTFLHLLLFSSARDEAHRKSIEKSIVELGTPVADSILVPPKEPKGKGKAKVCLTTAKKNYDKICDSLCAGLEC